MKRRLLSGLMAVLMLVNYLPVSVLSAEPQIIGEGTIASETDFVPALHGYCGRESDGTNVEWEINIDNNTLIISGQGAMLDFGLCDTESGEVGPFSDAPWFAYNWKGFYESFDSIDHIIVEKDISYIGDYAFYSDNEKDYAEGIFFCGDAPDIGTDIALASTRFYDEETWERIDKYVTFYYIPGTTGWTDSDAYDADAGTWNGYKLEAWDGVTIIDREPSVDDSDDAILSGYCGGEGDGTNLTWTLTPDGVFTISGQGAMADYRYYSDIPWREYEENITEIILEEGITTICDYAFYCPYVASISLPESLVSVGNYAFDLGQDVWTDDVVIYISENLTDIGYSAFRNIWCASSFVVDENNPNYCSDEYGVLYNKDMTVLMQYPVANNQDEYVIPEGVIEIEYDSMQGYFFSITIPSTVKYIDEFAFRDVYSEKFVVTENNEYYMSDEYGVLYNKQQTELIRYPCLSEETSYTIPDGVVWLGPHAFDSSTNLEEFILPNSLETIRDNTFCSCYALKNIVIPANVSMIEPYAFQSCKQLKGAFFKGNAQYLYYSSFARCHEDFTIYYIPGTTGWTDSDAYNADAGTWNGYPLATWDGVTIPESPEQGEDTEDIAQITGYAPGRNHEVERDSMIEVVIRFDRNISEAEREGYADLDTTKAPLEIRRVSDDALIIGFEGGSETPLGGTYTEIPAIYSDKSYVSIKIHSAESKFDTNEQYYITMGEGFIKMADGSVSPEIAKGDWAFTVIPKTSDNNITTIDYLALSELVYDNLVKDWTVYQNIASELSSTWEDTDILYSELYENLMSWEVVETKEDTSTGFYGAAFKHNDEVIIAFRGSHSLSDIAGDPADVVNDWIINDFGMLLGGRSSQIGNALKFYEDIKTAYPDCIIHVTGHSLGGGLADMVAARYGIKGESLNSAPFLDVLFYHFTEEMSGIFSGREDFSFVSHVTDGDMVGDYALERIKPKIVHQYNKSYTDSKHALQSMLTRNSDGSIVMTKILSDEALKGAANQPLFLGSGYNIALGTKNADHMSFGVKADYNPIMHPGGDQSYILFGGNGNDQIFGNEGKKDTLVGGNGDDLLDGRHGNDIYIYYKGQGHDTIHDITGDDELHLYGFADSDNIVIETEADEDFIEVSCNGELIVSIDKNDRWALYNSFTVYSHRTSGVIKERDITEFFKAKNFEYLMAVCCPVDVEIMDAEGNVVYTVKDGEASAAYTEYGNFYVFEEDDGGYGKLLDLVEGYEVNVVGVDAGEMDIVVYEINESEFSEPYAVESVPVTDTMSAAVVKKAEGEYELQVDNDSDGTADNTISFEIVEAGLPEVEVSNAVITTDDGNVHIEADLNSDALPETTATVVVGFYNEGRQVDLHFEMIDLAESTLALDFEISDDFDSCSLFIVNSAEEMIPIAAITHVQ